jgi:hypothetical protein
MTLIHASRWAPMLLAAALAGCAGALPPVATAAHPNHFPPPQPTATAMPPGSVPVLLSVHIDAASSVVFTGHPLDVTVLSEADGQSDTWPLAQATVNFGDGTSRSVTASCTGRASPALTLSHVYQTTGRFEVRVTAARFCNPAGQPELSPGSSEPGWPLVLPSPPAGSATWPRCGQAQLQISAGLADAGLGNRELLFTLRNVSSSGCQLYGYPGLRFASPDGQLLPAAVARGYLIPGVSPSLAALAPGGLASFDLHYVAGMHPASSCDWASQAEVFVPESFSYTMVSLASIGSGDDAVACGAGFQISPVVGGDTGVGFES